MTKNGSAVRSIAARPPGDAGTRDTAALLLIRPRSYTPRRMGAEQALRRQEQHDDENGEDRDRGEDAADGEIRRLLEDAEGEPANDGAAVVAEPAQRHRYEAVEIQHGAVSEEGEQQLAAGKA